MRRRFPRIRTNGAKTKTRKKKGSNTVGTTSQDELITPVVHNKSLPVQLVRFPSQEPLIARGFFFFLRFLQEAGCCCENPVFFGCFSFMAQFEFDWPTAGTNEKRFRKRIESALNELNDPPGVLGRLHVTEFSLGDRPPSIVLEEVTHVDDNGFRGVFRCNYEGTFVLQIETSLQLNLATNLDAEDGSYWQLGSVSSHEPFAIPVTFSCSRASLDGRLLVTWAPLSGVSGAFVEEPKCSVQVETSLSYLPLVRSLVQNGVESALRLFLRDFFPRLIKQVGHAASVPQIKQTRKE